MNYPRSSYKFILCKVFPKDIVNYIIMFLDHQLFVEFKEERSKTHYKLNACILSMTNEIWDSLRLNQLPQWASIFYKYERYAKCDGCSMGNRCMGYIRRRQCCGPWKIDIFDHFSRILVESLFSGKYIGKMNEFIKDHINLIDANFLFTIHGPGPFTPNKGPMSIYEADEEDKYLTKIQEKKLIEQIHEAAQWIYVMPLKATLIRYHGGDDIHISNYNLEDGPGGMIRMDAMEYIKKYHSTPDDFEGNLFHGEEVENLWQTIVRDEVRDGYELRGIFE